MPETSNTRFLNLVAELADVPVLFLRSALPGKPSLRCPHPRSGCAEPPQAELSCLVNWPCRRRHARPFPEGRLAVPPRLLLPLWTVLHIEVIYFLTFFHLLFLVDVLVETCWWRAASQQTTIPPSPSLLLSRVWHRAASALSGRDCVQQ